MLLGSLTLILMLVGAIGGPRRAFGRSPGALGAHLTLFDKYVKKCKTWIMTCRSFLSANCSITQGFIGVFEEP